MTKSFGALLKEARANNIDSTAGKPWTQERIAQELSIEAPTTISSWEQNKTKTLKPAHINRLSQILPVTVAEWLESLGYRVETLPLNEDERQVLAAFRRLRRSPSLQQGALRSIQAMAQSLAAESSARGRDQ